MDLGKKRNGKKNFIPIKHGGGGSAQLTPTANGRKTKAGNPV